MNKNWKLENNSQKAFVCKPKEVSLLLLLMKKKAFGTKIVWDKLGLGNILPHGFNSHKPTISLCFPLCSDFCEKFKQWITQHNQHKYHRIKI